MSSVPPNMPPGGTPPPPIPPFDPKTHWRAYREQQKAAWRAQRDAWRAQRLAWKANYVGMYGPRVPSMIGPILLVCVGVVALLVVSGRLDAGAFWSWYGRWWPLLLIGAGLALLAESALDMRRRTPVRRSGGFIWILILLAFLGVASTTVNHFRSPFFNHFGNNSFFDNFGLPRHDSDQPALKVQAHEVAYAGSDAAAQKIFDAEAAQVTVNGSVVTIQAPGNDKGRVNLSITVPKTAHVTVNS